MLTAPLPPTPNPTTADATAALVRALPSDFLFGVSTAAYQIEGAVAEGGRGRSVWDDFCAEPGRIIDGSSGAVACDSYHRYGEDVALMADLGVGAYRFSIAWPRIQPDGTGAPNQAGLDYYERLVDALLAAGIAPAATLFHWDLPSALQARGGWLERDTAYRFAEYAAHVATRLGDRVAMWMPVNEPNVVMSMGHVTGEHAPGLTLGLGALQVGHHLMLGHGLAVAALRATTTGRVGCANNHLPVWPASDAPADQAAADMLDRLYNRFFSDSVLLGAYPDGIGALLSGPVADDLAVISAPLDFYGVNSYNPLRIGAPDGERNDGAGPETMFRYAPVEGYPHTAFDWPVVPGAFRQLFVDLVARYPDMPPIYVTENGCSYPTAPGPDGAVHDTERVDFYAQHLRALAEARGSGVDIRGYFAWSLLDNFEWAQGYTQRFGLVWVDFETLERLPKDSFRWYADVIAAVRSAQ
jgi:beta-glucosidase